MNFACLTRMICYITAGQIAVLVNVSKFIIIIENAGVIEGGIDLHQQCLSGRSAVRIILVRKILRSSLDGISAAQKCCVVAPPAYGILLLGGVPCFFMRVNCQAIAIYRPLCYTRL